MKTLDTLINFVKQKATEEELEASRQAEKKAKEGLKEDIKELQSILSKQDIFERHEEFKKLYKKYSSQQEILDTLAKSKNSTDSSVYLAKSKELNFKISKVKEEARKIGTILEGSSNV